MYGAKTVVQHELCLYMQKKMGGALRVNEQNYERSVKEIKCIHVENESYESLRMFAWTFAQKKIQKKRFAIFLVSADT